MKLSFNNYCSLFLLSILCFLFISCSNKDKENEKLFEELNGALQKNTNACNSLIRDHFSSMQKKSEAPTTMDKANIWLPKMLFIDSISQIARATFTNLRNNNKEHFENDEIVKIYNKLLQYKYDILSVDNHLKKELDSYIFVTTDAVTNTELLEKEFINRYKTISKKMFSSLFINRITQVESILIECCSKQVGSVDGDLFWNYDGVITSQNSTHFKPNDKIEIIAGVGCYSSFPKPIITINNKLIPLNAEAVGVCKFKVSSIKGKHFVPVKIQFKSVYKKMETVEKTIEYTVDE